MHTTTPDSITVLHLDEKRSSFQRETNGAMTLKQDCTLGVASLASDHLRHSPPLPIEIENAIEVTEDAVMPLAHLFGGSRDLHLRGVGADLVSIGLNANALAILVFTVEDVESLFNQLVAFSQGRPMRQVQVPVDSRLYSACLILREVMHHFHFTQVHVDLCPAA